MRGIRNWLYVLQGAKGGAIDPKRIAAAAYDLVVVDHSATGGSDGIFTPQAVRLMRRDGKTRALAYMSIGEAESYRFYWRPQWSRGERPRFVGPANPNWSGNFWVRYWDESWRQILFGGPDGYLDRILSAGFDGVYLDKVDAYEEVPRRDRKRGLNPRAEMVRLVSDLSAYAKARRPEFLVFAQNGVELFEDPAYARAVDGIGQEEAWFLATDKARPPREAEAIVAGLEKALGMGKIVLTVDYCTGVNARTVWAESRARGFVPFISDAELTLVPPLAP